MTGEKKKKLEVLKAVVLILTLYLGFWVLVGLLLGDFVESKVSASSFLLDEILDGLLILLLLTTIRRSYSISFSEMGIVYQMPQPNMLLGLLLGVVLWLGAGVISDAMKPIIPDWAMVPVEHNFVTIYGNSHGVSKAILFLIFGLTTPLIEELLFRGLIHSALRRGFSAPAALMLSSALFGLWHGYPELIVITFLVGCGLALLRERGKSLLGPIVGHITINCLTLVFS